MDDKLIRAVEKIERHLERIASFFNPQIKTRTCDEPIPSVVSVWNVNPEIAKHNMGINPYPTMCDAGAQANSGVNPFPRCDTAPTDLSAHHQRRAFGFKDVLHDICLALPENDPGMDSKLKKALSKAWDALREDKG